MKFGIVNGDKLSLSIEEFSDIGAAAISVGLDPRRIDHGTLFHRKGRGGAGIIVSEYGLFENSDRLFSMFGRLYVGNAVLYAYDGEGKTVDMASAPFSVTWFNDIAAVEKAIERREVERPVMRIEGQPAFWSWPDPKPDLKAWADKVAALNVKRIEIDGDTVIEMKD